ncbi:MAG: glycosyltransferase family 39 protein [Bacilli bacterium]|nr:glycosyltransferase family 39 protein [Bacilli bacterium]
MSAVLNWFKVNFFTSEEGVKEKKSTPQRLLVHFVIALLVLVFIYLSYTIIKPLNQQFNTRNGDIAKAYIAVLFSLTLISYIVLFFKKKLTFEVNLFYIILVSFLIRLCYMLYTSGHTRQYDTWSSNHNGHYDYALYIFDNWSLPNHTFTEANIYQFYHPPLHYFISAVWMKIYSGIGFAPSLTSDTDALFCSVQILSTFYTFLITWYGVKTLRLLNLSKPATLIGAIFICFYPRLFQFSGQLNNDVLATLLVICSIFRLFKYKFEGHKYKDILLCALYLGLAMNVKLSAVIVALGFGAYFLYELIISIMKKDGSVKLVSLIIQYALFLMICAPIGLWFQFYAHNVYGIPFNFVFRNLNSKLFTGTRSYVLSHSYLNVEYYDANNSGILYENDFVNFLARFVSPFLVRDYIARGAFAYAFDNYNILTYAIKSTIFGEFAYWGGEGFAVMALIMGYIFWFSIIIITIYNLIKHRGDMIMFISIAIILSIIVFYLYLQISMPYGCSMDARYIVPILLPLGILLTKNVNVLEGNKKDKIMKIILSGSGVGFSLFSALFYCFAI